MSQGERAAHSGDALLGAGWPSPASRALEERAAGELEVEQHDQHHAQPGGHAGERDELQAVHADRDQAGGQAGEQGGHQPLAHQLPAAHDPQHAEGDAGGDDRHVAGKVAAHLVDRLADKAGKDDHRDTQQGVGAEGIIAEGGQGDGDEGGITHGEHDGRQDGDGRGAQGGQQGAEADVDDHDLHHLVARGDQLDEADDARDGAGLDHQGDLQDGGEHHQADGQRGDDPRQADLQGDAERGLEIEPGGQQGQRPAHQPGDIGGGAARQQQDEDGGNGEQGDEEGHERII